MLVGGWPAWHFALGKGHTPPLFFLNHLISWSVLSMMRCICIVHARVSRERNEFEKIAKPKNVTYTTRMCSKSETARF